VAEPHWQLQDAKQRLSELIRAARTGEAQVITRHGQEVAVVIDIEEYRLLQEEIPDFKEFLRAGPTFDDLDLERDPRPARIPDLSD
jgi:prevent-host-death family protein